MRQSPRALYKNFVVSFVCLSIAAPSFRVHAFGDAERSFVGPFSAEHLHSAERLASVFDSWLKRFPRSYSSLEQERLRRLQIFSDNLLYVHLHNRQNHTYKLGLNKFADLSNEEFKALYFGSPKVRWRLPLREPLFHPAPPRFVYRAADPLPSSIDWRSSGSVTRVKDQGSCGSCWAFSTTAAIEGINQIVTGDLTALSEQELVDCDTVRNMGCNGGLMDYAFEFILNNGGIGSEDHYPYKGRKGQCESTKGILTGGCGTELDHGVAIVGYGSKAGLDFWIVKNSWGSSWGERRYIRIQRGGGAKKEAAGLCGINKGASFPLKTGVNPPIPPPSPPASRTKCDSIYSCPPANTCCCGLRFAKHCLAWGCCPLESAVCCKDHYHCCPGDFPICNIDAGSCRQEASSDVSVIMLNRTAAVSGVAAVFDQ